MLFSIRYLFRYVYWLWQIVLWLGFLVCVVIWGGILFFAELPQYRSYIEQQLHLVLGQPVVIGELSTYWVGGYPTLSVQNIRLLGSDARTPIAEMGYLEIMLDLKASLQRRQLVTRLVIASGCQLAIVRYPNGQLGLQGMNPTSSATTTSSFAFLGLPHEVRFQANTLSWLDPQNPPFILTQVHLRFEETQQESYQLKGHTQFQGTEVFQVKHLNFDSQISLKKSIKIYTQWNLDHIHFRLNENQLSVARLQGQTEFKQQQFSKIWQLETKNLLAWSATSRSPFTLPRFKVTYKNQSIQGEVHAFTLNTIKNFIHVTSSPVREWFARGEGRFHNIQGYYTTPQDWSVKILFSQLSFPSQSPMIQNASGQLSVGPQSGKLDVDDIKIKLTLPELPTHPLLFNTLHGKITWQRFQQAWQFSFDQVQWQDANHLRFAMTGQVRLEAQQVLEHDLHLYLERASAQQLRDYFPTALAKKIELSTGQFHTLHISATGPDWSQTALQFKGRLEQVNLFLKEPSLKVEDFSGTLETSLKEGTLNLRHAHVTLFFPKLYSQPLSFHQLQGQLAWEYREHQWHLILHPLHAYDHQLHLTVQGQLHIPWPDGSLSSDLVIDFQGGQLAQIASYVPDQRLPKLSKWFHHAQLTGRLTQAKAILKGPFNQLFKDGTSGKFNFNAKVDQAHIIYAQGWPAITHLHAQVVIEKRRMTITALRGQIFNSHLHQLKVSIPDLASPHPFITVVGGLKGNAADGIHFLAQSPLNRSINLGERLELKGRMTLQLDLKFPLSSSRQPASQIRGKISLQDTTLREKHLNIIVSGIHGNLNFDNQQVVAKKMRGQLSGILPIEFSFHNLKNQSPARTIVDLKGDINDVFLQKYFSHPSSNLLFSGQSTWKMNLDIPRDPKQPTHILFESDLSGMNIHLPFPLGKTAQQVMPLQVNIHQNNLTQIDFRYGELAQGIVQLHPTSSPQGIFQFGTLTQNITLPEQPGLLIESTLPKFSLSEWQPLLQSFRTTTSSSAPKLPLSLNAKIEQLELFGQTFEKVIVHAQSHLNTWHGTITGKNIEGQISYSPTQQVSFASNQDTALDLTFNHLDLTVPRHWLNKPKEPSSSFSSLTPHQFPTLSFHCNALQLGSFDLGQVTITTQKTAEGLDLLLNAHHDVLKILVQVQWQHFLDRPQTQIQVQLSNDTIDHMLQHFGFHHAPIEGARNQWILDARWSGSPMAFQLKNVIGHLNFLMTEGRIINVEPGIGRILGLFDIWALPRRLNLDFSDVFAKGFGFTQAMGSFSIHEGHVYTNHFMLQGTIAQIEVAGNTDLMSHTYHQTVTVMPHISNTLPIAGTFAGGLGVGMIALVIQQLLQNEIEKNIHYKYLVTGKWDKPHITSLPFFE